MNKFNNVSNLANVTTGLSEMEQQISEIENSKLTEEEKNKALKSYNKMVITILLGTIGILILFTSIVIIICNIISGDLKILLCLITSIIAAASLLVFGITVKKLFPDWKNYYDKVDNGFDGLSSEEINKLKPNLKENLIIKEYKRKSLKYGIIYLIALAIVISIVIGFKIYVYLPVAMIFIVVITIIWYIKEDTCQVEIHRIKSGYYKKGFGYICYACKTEVRIKFEEYEKYNSLPEINMV